MTGTIVTKIAANSFATSAMGAQSNALPARALFGVSASEASEHGDEQHVAHEVLQSRRAVPNTSNAMPGFHTPLISTSTTITASNTKLILPSMPSGGVSGVGSRNAAARRALRQ